MKKVKEYKLSDKHYAIAKINDDEILIYIEEWKPVLWGLINMPFEVSSPKAFKIILNNVTVPKEKGEVIRDGIYVGCQWEYRNISTFNLKYEIDILYASFLKSIKEADLKRECIDNFINSID